MYGKKIKDIRKELGMTQIELSRETGIDQSMISLYEREETAIPLDRLILIAEALDLELYDFLDLDTKKSKTGASVGSKTELKDILRALKKIGFNKPAIEIVEHMNGKQIDQWQVRAVKAIID